MMKKFFQLCLIAIGIAISSNADVIPYAPVQEHLLVPVGTNLLQAKALDGSLIELPDGAQFAIAESDHLEVIEWKTNAPLMISPNPYFFSKIDFFITNRHTNTYVGATYVASPVIDHPLTTRIYYIDHYYGEIILIDGKGNQLRWEVDPQDIQYIEKWEKGDTVTIGVYNNWYSKLVSQSKFILISYENLPYVKFIRANLKPL